MAESRPLRLQRQKAAGTLRARKFDHLAEVLVETPVFHLSEPFTYGIPAEFVPIVRVGSVVSVPFKEGDLTGLVIALRDGESGSYKPIRKPLTYAPIPAGLLSSISELAKRYVRRPIDFLRFVPGLPAEMVTTSEPVPSQRVLRTVETTKSNGTMRAISLLQAGKGRRLLLLATEREARYAVRQLAAHGETVLFYQASVRATERRAILKTLAQSPQAIVVGTRSSIFLPVEFNSIVIMDEGSPHYWEERSPYWNVRDVALVRSATENSNIHFVSASASLEIERLARTGYLATSKERAFLRNPRKFDFAPDTYHRTIRETLGKGAVLVSVSDKGYSNIFCCDRCKSLPNCECGGRYKLKTSIAVECGLCSKVVSDWRCKECGSDRKFMVRKGASRVVEELGRAFPRTKIVNLATDPNMIELDGPTIYVATPGLEPLGMNFAGLVLLDGDVALQRYGLRGEEILRKRWFEVLSSTSPQGRVFLSLPRAHRLSQALLVGDPQRAIDSELAERLSVDLPPARRLIRIEGPESDLLTLSEELARDNQDLIVSGAASGAIVLRVKVEKATELLTTLFALQRYRSAAKRPLLDIQVDPFDI